MPESTPADATRPRVLLVGPYERDNLGDLLFPLVTERYLAGAEILYGVPFAPSTQELLQRPLVRYGPVLDREQVDVVWSVGGQLGGVDVARAYRMAAAPEAARRFADAEPDERRALLRAAAGGTRLGSPYVPFVVEHPRNAGAITVVNSAGLSSLRGAPRPHRRGLLATLRGTDAVVVRDRASAELLRREGINHRLVPDAVHAIGTLRPPASRRPADAVVVQISHRLFERLGRDEIAQALAAATAGLGLRVRLLPAGLAAGHDALDDLAWLQGRLGALAADLDVSIVASRRPWDLVDEIAAARLVISTSLHVRIIACAYDAARISLDRRKVTSYARAWDSSMPAGVALDGLTVATRAALARADDPGVIDAARRLTRRAHEHLEDLSAKTLALAARDTDATRAARAQARRAHWEAPLRPQRPRRLRIPRLRRDRRD